MAIYLVQTATSGSNSNTTAQATTLPAATRTGNLIVVAINSNVVNVNSVTDTQGNTYTKLSTLNYTGNSTYLNVFYAKNITGSSTPPNVTVNYSGSGWQTNIIVREYSGLEVGTVVDAFAQANVTAASASSGNITTTNANDVLVGFLADNTSYTATPGSGYGNFVTSNTNTSYPLYIEDRIVSATGTYAATFTRSGSGFNAGALIVAFKEGALPTGRQLLTVDGNGNTTSGWAAEGGDFTRIQSYDGDTTRLYTPTANDVRQFSLTDTTGLESATISSVTVFANFRSLDPVSNTIQIGVRSGGTDYYGGTKDTNPYQTYTMFYQTWTTDPATNAAWTVAALNALQIGVKKINSAGGALTFMYTEVAYTAPTNVTITKTQLSTARLTRTLSLNQLSTARISKIATLSQIALSRIATTLSRQQQAQGRVTKSITRSQISQSRITKSLTLSQTAVSRIARQYSLSQQSIASVTKTLNRSQTSVSRITKTFERVQIGTARVSKTLTLNQTVVARIVATVARTQVANARVTRSFTLSQLSVARIAVIKNVTNVSRAYITGNGTPMGMLLAITQAPAAVLSYSQVARARITKSLTLSQTSTARTTRQLTYSQSAIAKIASVGNTYTQLANARIRSTVTKSQPATAKLTKTFSVGQVATSRISKTLNATQTAAARISRSFSTGQTAIARIVKLFNRSQTATARVSLSVSNSQPANASIARTTTKTQTAGAFIATVRFAYQVATGRLVESTVVQPKTRPIYLRDQPNRITLSADDVGKSFEVKLPESITLDGYDQTKTTIGLSNDDIYLG